MSAPKTILVVDDSATMRRMVMATLQKLDGVTFQQAQSGLEALERLTIDKMDLVILDLNMPDLHGLEVLRFVRAHAAFSSIPVIILTTRGDDESKAAALGAGATRYLTKPFSPEAFVEQVQSLLHAAP